MTIPTTDDTGRERAVNPVRLQLRRTKGFNLQELSRAANGLEAERVARPSVFGNPFTIESAQSYHNGGLAAGDGVEHETPRQTAVRWFREWLNHEWIDEDFPNPPTSADVRRMLRGRNLACWCRIGQICHADALLEIANAESSPPIVEGVG